MISIIPISQNSKIIESILKLAIDFSNQEAMDKYLKEHPDADPSNHRVVEQKITEEKVDKLKEKLQDKKQEISHDTKIEKDFENTDEWKKEHTTVTQNGSLVIGTPHADGTPEERQYIENDLMQSVLSHTEKAIQNGKKVVFLAEGETRGPEGSEQRTIADSLSEKYKDSVKQDSWDDGMSLYDDQSKAFNLLSKVLGKDKLKVHNAIFDMGQGTAINEDYFDSDEQKKLFHEMTGIEIPTKEQDSNETNLGMGHDPKDPNATKQFYAEGSLKQKLYDMTFPQDKNLPETQVSKFQKMYNNIRQLNMLKKIKDVEKEGNVVIVTPGASHAFEMREQLGKL